MNDTKEKILLVSLDLFAQKGYSAVSIRDICKLVEIKESSVYYHFKNKQAIYEEIIRRFQDNANSMMENFFSLLTNSHKRLEDNFFTEVCNQFFECYLMDDFCNKVMRLMLIEQFSNEDTRKLYDYWLFEMPLAFQSKVFNLLAIKGVTTQTDNYYIALQYYAPIFFYAQKWLFSGTLSEDRKNAFRQDAYKHIQIFFSNFRRQ